MIRGALAVLVALAFVVGGCEKPQQVAYKKGHYAGKSDTQAWANDRFKNDRGEWERAVKARNLRQNEYERTSGRGG
jgi:hypothetical protein